MAKPLLDKLGGGRGWEVGGHGHSEERVEQKSRLGRNSLSQQMRQLGLRTPPDHSHPTWRSISPPKNTRLDTDSFPSRRTYSTFHTKHRSKGTGRRITALSPQTTASHSGPRGPVSRDRRCFATVVRSAGYLVSIGAKQSPSNVGGGLQKPEIPCYVLWFTNGLERPSRKFSRVLHLMVTSELVSINGGVF